MHSQPDKATTTSASRPQQVYSKRQENTRYALASTAPSPSSDVWMTSDSAMSWLLSTERPPSGQKLFAECLMCGEVFTRSPGKFRKAEAAVENLSHACSNACRAHLRSIGKAVELGCAECGQSFQEWASAVAQKKAKGQTQFFCSGSCYGAYRSRTFIGERHHRYTAVTMRCDNCTVEFTRNRYYAEKMRSVNSFCSRECYVEAMHGDRIQRVTGVRGPRSYPPEFKSIQSAVMATNPKCVACGLPARDLHHKDEDKENNELSNLVAVCRSCHVTHHRSRAIPELSP